MTFASKRSRTNVFEIQGKDHFGTDVGDIAPGQNLVVLLFRSTIADRCDLWKFLYVLFHFNGQQ